MLLENLSFGNKILMTLDFFKTIIMENVEKVKEKTKQKTTEIKSIMVNQIQKNKLDVRALEWIMFCINITNVTKQYMNEIYNSNSNIRFVVDNSIYCCKCLFCILTNQRIQPFKNNWICTSILMKQTEPSANQYYFNDVYVYLDNNYDFLENFKESLETILSIINLENNLSEGMVTMKMGNQYINRICFNNTKSSEFNISLPLIQSKHQFISVKYSHPRMKEAIFIDIDKEYYYAYNELFSPVFVKRYLEYQPLNYEFDMDYELQIMDNDINSYKLTSKQYILLADSTYTIKNIE
jgi:hypothetical protein